MMAEITFKENGNHARQPRLLRFAANVVSLVLHPIFIPVYVACFLLFLHPMLFAGYAQPAKWKLVATIFVNLCLLPLVTVFLCWRLKFVGSMLLATQRDRIIPLAATMIFYFWCWFVLKNFTEIPALFRQFLLGSFITVIVAWIANIYFKISLHALGAGGMLCFMLLVVFGSDGGSAGYLAAAAVVAGLVCSARLVLENHRPADVYAGLVLGMLSQWVAVWLT